MPTTARRTLLICALPLLAIPACHKTEETSHRPIVQDRAIVSDPCVESVAADCASVEARIAELEQARDAALAADDRVAVAKISLDLNREHERLELLRHSEATPENLAALESKYQQLHLFLEASLATSNPRGTEPVTSDPNAPVVDGSETDRTSVAPSLPALVYHKLEVDAVKAVMQDFGDLYIAPSGNVDGELQWHEVSVDMPWAGYWYPLSGKELFDGDNAPLAKLDKVMSRLGRSSNAAETERSYRDFGAEDSWEGRCFAWATAAVASPEPKAPVEFEGITFSTQDQKALLTKIHELYPTKFYGIRYDGNYVTDGTIQDIRPEAFHRIFVAMLVEHGRPFIVDDDPGIEVWSKPVYRMRWTVQPDPEIENAFVVDAFPFLVNHRVRESEDPTGISDRSAPAYRYRLYVDPTHERDGQWRVIAGEWLDDSLKTHPDSVAIVEQNGALGSSNAGVHAALDVIRRIVGLEE